MGCIGACQEKVGEERLFNLGIAAPPSWGRELEGGGEKLSAA